MERRQAAVLRKIAKISVESGIKKANPIMINGIHRDTWVVEQRNQAFNVVFVGMAQKEMIDSDLIAIQIQSVFPNQKAKRTFAQTTVDENFCIIRGHDECCVPLPHIKKV